MVSRAVSYCTCTVYTRYLIRGEQLNSITIIACLYYGIIQAQKKKPPYGGRAPPALLGAL